jgi:signal transduction histidine kinase
VALASQRAVRQLRDVVWSVDSRHDSFESLLEHLRDHARHILEAAALETDFQVALAGLPAEPLTMEGRQALFLIFKEALHNVVKHARGATTATICLERAPGRELQLTVADDGPGLPAHLYATEGATNHGLDNMRRRAQAVGGTVRYQPSPTGGLEVRLRLPLR